LTANGQTPPGTEAPFSLHILCVKMGSGRPGPGPVAPRPKGGAMGRPISTKGPGLIDPLGHQGRPKQRLAVPSVGTRVCHKQHSLQYFLVYIYDS
jgi:hypothetical protein